MAVKSKKDFKVNVYYPREENKEEYENRMARAVAKILWGVFPINKIEEIIDMYRKDLNNEK